MQDLLALHGRIDEFLITYGWKRVARLERGGSMLSVGAMSRLQQCSVQSLTVDGQQWTDDIFYTSGLVDHILTSDSKDRGRAGQHNACHAEKQLIAYFIDRHVFLPRDCLPDWKLEEQIKSQEDKIEEFLSITKIGREVASLRKKRDELEYKLFDEDGNFIEKNDDCSTPLSEFWSLEADLFRLTASPQARPLWEGESRLQELHQQLHRHNDLTQMANAPPPALLTQATESY